MALARENEMSPLGESELTRLVRAAGEAAYKPDTILPHASEGVFRKRTLMEIAREAIPDAPPSRPQPAEAPGIAAEADDPAPDVPAATMPKAPSPPPAQTATPLPGAPAPRVPDQPAPLPPQPAFVRAPAPPSAAAPQAPTVQPAEGSQTPMAATPEALKRARDEGFREGEAAGRSVAEARLAEAFAALEAAIAVLVAPDVGALQALRQQINQAVLALASARAGAQIDHMPLAFAQRIEALADRVQADLAATVIRLNPQDLQAITTALMPASALSVARLLADESLARGDVDLCVGGLRLSDRLGGAPATMPALQPDASAADGGARAGSGNAGPEPHLHDAQATADQRTER